MLEDHMKSTWIMHGAASSLTWLIIGNLSNHPRIIKKFNNRNMPIVYWVIGLHDYLLQSTNTTIATYYKTILFADNQEHDHLLQNIFTVD